jgi:hypothetical protein
MSILEAARAAVGELTALLAARVAGKVIDVSPQKAQRIGEYMVMGLILGAGILVTCSTPSKPVLRCPIVHRWANPSFQRTAFGGR